MSPSRTSTSRRNRPSRKYLDSAARFALENLEFRRLLSYSLTDWFSVTAGVVEGWDVADDNNRSATFTGQLAFTPLKDLSTNLNWIVGPLFPLVAIELAPRLTRSLVRTR